MWEGITDLFSVSIPILFLCLCSAIWSHNEAWEGIETILGFSIFYAEYQTTNYSGWIFGQSLSDQHSETTPNSVCPIFWISVDRTAQREHDHNLVSYLLYLRYLQVLLDLRGTTLYGERHGLPSRAIRFYVLLRHTESTLYISVFSPMKISLCLLLVFDRFIDSYVEIHWTITFYILGYSWFSFHPLARYKLCDATSFEFQTSKVSTGQCLGTWEIIPTLCALLHFQYINFISSTVRPLGSQLGHLFGIVWNIFC